jgi:gamma-glutamyltranspeptidase/glutathione hydrolase
MLATVIPGSFDGWMLMLRDYGSLDLRTVLEPAIHYAEHGHPMLQRVSQTIAEMADFFRAEWPTSHAMWLPNGAAPKPNGNFANPTLAATWTRLLAEAEARTGREAQIEAARDAFYRGFVAEAIDRFVRDTSVMDVSGSRHKGVLTGEDMANWQASVEAPRATITKAGRCTRPAPGGRGRCCCSHSPCCPASTWPVSTRTAPTSSTWSPRP